MLHKPAIPELNRFESTLLYLETSNLEQLDGEDLLNLNIISSPPLGTIQIDYPRWPFNDTCE